MTLQMRSRAMAAGVHALMCLAIAGFAWIFITRVLYPAPYAEISGAFDMFWLIVGIDTAMGPLMTAIVFDRRKPRRELRRDLLFIAVLQLAALAYGLHTLYVARPVAMVLEVNRFSLVTANAVYQPDFDSSPSARSYQSLSITGPVLLSAKEPAPGSPERLDVVKNALAGYDLGQRPRFWQSYELRRSDALAKSREASLLLRQYPKQARAIEEKIGRLGLTPATARFLPLLSRDNDWIVILDREGHVTGLVEASGFF